MPTGPPGHGFERLHPAIRHHVVNTLGWPSLRPLQHAAIDPIVAGAHVLALAPTASGKTEAAMLPLLHRMATEDWHGLSVLYLCPLKALLNNLEPRLHTLTGFVGRRAGLWHGDIGQAVRRSVRTDPPDVLLTTPESLEGMLISRVVDHAALLGNVRAVVVDEIHAFAGDDRGWHLAAVLERLAALTRTGAHTATGAPAAADLQRIGLSATVGDPAALLDWFAGSSPGPRAVVQPTEPAPAGAPGAPGAPGADVTVDHVGTVANAATVIAALHRGEKRLVFAESRSRVEALAVELRRREVHTFVSHSSLSVDERRRAEAAFAEARDCVIVATSTLELGIDVGDLDRVVQLDAPGTVASFLQRLGRTGRRPGTRRNTLFLTLRPEEHLLQALGLLLRWRDGYVEAVAPPPLPYHLLVQQILAITLQDNGIGRSVLVERAGRLPEFARYRAAGILDRVLDHLLAHGYLFDDAGIISIGPGAERSFGYRNFVELTSSFTRSPLLTARWGTNDIGLVDPLSLQRRSDPGAGPGAHPATALLLGGRSWQVLGVDWRARTVAVTPVEGPGRSRWQGSSQPLSSEIADGMRRVLAGEDVPDVTISRRAADTLAELRADAPWARPGTTTLVRRDGATRWWTFAGLRANAALAARLDGRATPGRVDNLSIPVDPATSADGLAQALRTLMAEPAAVHPDARRYAEELKFAGCLPDDLALATANARLDDPAAVARATTEALSADAG